MVFINYPPSYHPITCCDTLVAAMTKIASAAPRLPFYYYHIPAVTQARVDMPTFLQHAAPKIANLAGIKYTAPTVHEYQACLEMDNRRFDILWGLDEMLLAGLTAGAQGAIGSTYNIAPKLYRQLINAFAAGDLEQARQLQLTAVNLIRAIVRWPTHPAIKQILTLRGFPCGPCRQPHSRLSAHAIDALRATCEQMGWLAESDHTHPTPTLINL